MVTPVATLPTPTPIEYTRLLEYVSSSSTWDLYQELRPYNCTCLDHAFQSSQLRPDGAGVHYPLCPVGKWHILGDKLQLAGIPQREAAASARKTARFSAKAQASAKAAVKSSGKAKASASKSVKAKPAKTKAGAKPGAASAKKAKSKR